jgi:hypothetical protein
MRDILGFTLGVDSRLSRAMRHGVARHPRGAFARQRPLQRVQLNAHILAFPRRHAQRSHRIIRTRFNFIQSRFELPA